MEPSNTVEYTKSTEFFLFSDPERVRQGVILTEDGDANTGKVIHWLGDLPTKKTYRTEYGNKLERISDYEVKFEGTILIIPHRKPTAPGAPTDPTTAGLPKMQRKLEGESEYFFVDDIELALTETKAVRGTLFVTNYQLLFQNTDPQGRVHEVCIAPLATISRIEKIGGKKAGYLLQSKERQLILHRKDFHREVKINMRTSATGVRKKLADLIYKMAFPGDIRRLFAFAYAPQWTYSMPKPLELQATLKSECNVNTDGWLLYNPDMEFARMGIPEGWTWTDINRGHEVCKSYPERLIIPAKIPDEKLRKAANFRTKGRIPMLSWVHKNKASITRSSQPKAGALSSRCVEDELLLQEIRLTNPTPNGQLKEPILMIMDPRPQINAEANRAMGNGYERPDNYKATQLLFLDVENIHAMRSSQTALRTLCHQPASRDDAYWYSQVEATAWLTHIRAILLGVSKIVRSVNSFGVSVLVHCSDGWDRTSQVVALAMLCMDPYYRTLSGFCILIEKEWILAGHMFQSRLGHGSSNYGDENRAPIFLQFIDCVWQLARQNPLSFEFNEAFLSRLVDETTNCRFGTFVSDCDSQKKQFNVEGQTTSLWSYIHRKENYYRYLNPLYSPPPSPDQMMPVSACRSDVVLTPKTSMKVLQLWQGFYLRSRNFRDRSNEVILERVFEMQCKVEELEVRVQDYERELSELRNQLLSRSQEAHAPSPVVGSLQSSPSYYGFLAGSPSKRQLAIAQSKEIDEDTDMLAGEDDEQDDATPAILAAVQSTHYSAAPQQPPLSPPPPAPTERPPPVPTTKRPSSGPPLAPPPTTPAPAPPGPQNSPGSTMVIERRAVEIIDDYQMDEPNQ